MGFGGWTKIWLGEPEAALERFARAMRLSPLDPTVTGMRSATAHAHFFLGRYGEAASWAAMALQDNPDLQFGLRIAAARSFPVMSGSPHSRPPSGGAARQRRAWTVRPEPAHWRYPVAGMQYLTALKPCHKLQKFFRGERLDHHRYILRGDRLDRFRSDVAGHHYCGNLPGKR